MNLCRIHVQGKRILQSIFCNNQKICLNGYTNTEKFTIVSLLFVKNPLNNLINDDKINFLN